MALNWAGKRRSRKLGRHRGMAVETATAKMFSEKGIRTAVWLVGSADSN